MYHKGVWSRRIPLNDRTDTGRSQRKIPPSVGERRWGRENEPCFGQSFSLLPAHGHGGARSL